MHKLAASATVFALAALVLTGCAASGSSSCTPQSPADAATRDLVTATGEVGTAPDVEVLTPVLLSKGVSWQAVEGEGAPITAANQLFGADLELINGGSGETLYQSEYGDTPSETLTGDSLDTLLPGAGALLECAQPGSRVVFGIPGDALTEETRTRFELQPDDSILGIVDIRTVYLDRANGADQFQSGTGLPSVVREPSGRTGVVVPDVAAPTSTVVELLKKGDGEEVAADSLVLVQYTAVSWNDRELIESTWDATPKAIAPNDETQPFAAELEGETVGSQVLIVVPSVADAAAGTDADANIYVVDILGILPPQAAE